MLVMALGKARLFKYDIAAQEPRRRPALHAVLNTVGDGRDFDDYNVRHFPTFHTQNSHLAERREMPTNTAADFSNY